MGFVVEAVYADGRRETIVDWIPYADFGALVDVLVHNEPHAPAAETHAGRALLHDWLLYHFELGGWSSDQALSIAGYMLTILLEARYPVVSRAWRPNARKRARVVRMRLHVPSAVTERYADVDASARPDWDNYAEGFVGELTRVVNAGAVRVDLRIRDETV